MDSKIVRCCCIVGCLLILFYSSIKADEEADMKLLAETNNTFALNLYAILSQQEGNLFFSPYSISTALAMTYAGARGDTERQMAQTLHFTLPSEALHAAFARLADRFQQIQQQGQIALNIANALWLQQDFPLSEQFVKLTETYYDANLFPVNFKDAAEDVRMRINAWVAEATQQKITNLLAPGTLNALTRLVLTNAIYFKGNWHYQFEEDFTTAESFWTSPDKDVMVSMMHQQNSFKYAENSSLQVLELLYAGEDLAMVILLPQELDGLKDLEQVLTIDQVAAWTAEAAYQDVEVYLPKFTITSQFGLADTLSAMGMEDAFSEGKADFSGMTSAAQLSISAVLHKAFVEVNEEGTEAAAATAVAIGVTSVMEPQPVPVFRADHPFLFLIRENTSQSILFIGRVVNPAA